MPDDKRSYKEIRQCYDRATQDVDDAICDLAQLVEQLKTWQRSRAGNEVNEMQERQDIDFSKVRTLDRIQSLVQAWREAAEAEYNHYVNAHDSSLATPRIWSR